MQVIIKSGEQNWTGKEFGHQPAKLYSDFDEAVCAIQAYHFYQYDPEAGVMVYVEKLQKIEIICLSDTEARHLLSIDMVRL